MTEMKLNIPATHMAPRLPKPITLVIGSVSIKPSIAPVKNGIPVIRPSGQEDPCGAGGQLWELKRVGGPLTFKSSTSAVAAPRSTLVSDYMGLKYTLPAIAAWSQPLEVGQSTAEACTSGLITHCVIAAKMQATINSLCIDDRLFKVSHLLLFLSQAA